MRSRSPSVSWGGRPRPENEGALNWYLNRVRAAREMGIRYLPGAAVRTAFAGMIDYDEQFMDSVCRSLDGDPILVPWLWDHNYKDKPACWWCTNSPLYRRYLLHRLEQTMAVKPYGLHIDDYRVTSGSVTWLDGCFCRHCMAAFRDYLRRNVASEELARLGIADLATFDYRQFLLDRGVKPGEYKKRRARLRLAEEFLHFHGMASNAWGAAYRKRAGIINLPFASRLYSKWPTKFILL